MGEASGELADKIIEEIKKTFSLGIGAIMAGIASILAGVATALATFMFKN